MDNNNLINVAELGEHLKRKRLSGKLSLRDVAKQTDVSAATLSRIENGHGVPDATTLARLARWLRIPLDRVVSDGSARAKQRTVIYNPSESTPDIVEAHLRADRKLTPETAKALAELFRVAYDQFSRQVR